MVLLANTQQEKYEDSKEVIRIRKSKKDKQLNIQKKREKLTNNDLQSITEKTKDRETRTPLRIISI
jgi:hypothetical protein